MCAAGSWASIKATCLTWTEDSNSIRMATEDGAEAEGLWAHGEVGLTSIALEAEESDAP